jgi:hypothetical protein
MSPPQSSKQQTFSQHDHATSLTNQALMAGTAQFETDHIDQPSLHDLLSRSHTYHAGQGLHLRRHDPYHRSDNVIMMSLVDVLDEALQVTVDLDLTDDQLPTN